MKNEIFSKIYNTGTARHAISTIFLNKAKLFKISFSTSDSITQALDSDIHSPAILFLHNL